LKGEMIKMSTKNVDLKNLPTLEWVSTDDEKALSELPNGTCCLTLSFTRSMIQGWGFQYEVAYFESGVGFYRDEIDTFCSGQVVAFARLGEG